MKEVINMLPLVSVIIPVYNNKEWLEIAVKSVIRQNYTNWELIVIDDGSTEVLSDLECLNNEKITYIRNENNGVAFSRNYGMKLAKGKYIAFLDSDDFWDEQKLQEQVNAMEKYNAKWSQHNYYYIDDKSNQVIDKIDTYKYRKHYKKYFFTSFKVQTSCFMVERQAVIENKIYFDEHKKFGEEAKFYMELMKRYKLLCLNKYLGYFRIRKNNAGFDIKKQLISRSNTWIEKDDFFSENTNIFIKIAYEYCYLVCKLFDCFKWPSPIICKIVYCFPWIIFKCEAKTLDALTMRY